MYVRTYHNSYIHTIRSYFFSILFVQQIVLLTNNIFQKYDLGYQLLHLRAGVFVLVQLTSVIYIFLYGHFFYNGNLLENH